MGAEAAEQSEPEAGERLIDPTHPNLFRFSNFNIGRALPANLYPTRALSHFPPRYSRSLGDTVQTEAALCIPKKT
jgi:hypothetical protein